MSRNASKSSRIKINVSVVEKLSLRFYGTLYISQSMSPEYELRSIGVYIKLVKHLKHSTNKLRIVNVDSCKSGYKFQVSHT